MNSRNMLGDRSQTQSSLIFLWNVRNTYFHRDSWLVGTGGGGREKWRVIAQWVWGVLWADGKGFFGRTGSLLLPTGFSPGMASRGYSLGGAHRLLMGQSTGSGVVAYKPSCLTASGIFPDQGLNLCPSICWWILNHLTIRKVLYVLNTTNIAAFMHLKLVIFYVNFTSFFKKHYRKKAWSRKWKKFSYFYILIKIFYRNIV